MRGVCRIMMNRIHRFFYPAVIIKLLTRIGIHIKAWEIAAADVHADAVAFFEDIAGGIKPYRWRRTGMILLAI